MYLRLISFMGLFAMVGIAWLLSRHKNRFPRRVVIGGVFLQFLLAAVVFNTTGGQWLFQVIGDFFTQISGYVDEGTGLVFGIYPREGDPELPHNVTLL